MAPRKSDGLVEDWKAKLGEWIDQPDSVVGRRRAHVFGVERGDPSLFARSQEHAVPMRQAEAPANVKSMIDHLRRGHHEWKQLPKRGHVTQQRFARDLA